MIDWKKSADLNNTTVRKLKTWFKKYPSSGKKVVRICNSCGRNDKRYFYAVGDLCHKCGHNTSEHRKNQSKNTTRQYSTQKARDEQTERLNQYHVDNPGVARVMSDRMIQYHKDHPEKSKTHSEWMVQYHIDNPGVAEEQSKFAIEYWSDQTNRDEMSDIITNSDAAKVAQDGQRGGRDILKHHFIYDHNNPNQHTVDITRAEHTSHHNWMKRNGLEVPHYNVTEENKDIFKLRRY